MDLLERIIIIFQCHRNKASSLSIHKIHLYRTSLGIAYIPPECRPNSSPNQASVGPIGQICVGFHIVAMSISFCLCIFSSHLVVNANLVSGGICQPIFVRWGERGWATITWGNHVNHATVYRKCYLHVGV